MKSKWGVVLIGVALVLTLFLLNSSYQRDPPQKDLKISDYVEGMETPPPNQKH